MIKNLIGKLKLMKYKGVQLGKDLFLVLKKNVINYYGVMDKKGNLVQDIKFVDVKLKGNFLLVSQNHTLYDIIDIKTNQAVEQNVTIDDECIYYNKPWLIVGKGGKQGLFNTTNENLSQETQYIYEELTHLCEDAILPNTYFIAKKDGKYSLLKNDQPLLPFEFDNIEEGATPRIVLARKNDNSDLYKVIELYKNTGEKLTEDDFYAVDNEFFFNNYFRVFEGGRVGLMDIDGKYFVDCNYTKIKKFKLFEKNYQYRTSKSIHGFTTSYPVDYSKYLAVVKGNGLYGCINENGTEIIPCIFDDIDVDYDNIEVEILGKTYVLNNSNFASMIESIISAPELVGAVNVEDCMKKIYAWETEKPEKQDNEMKEYKILHFQHS